MKYQLKKNRMKMMMIFQISSFKMNKSYENIYIYLKDNKVVY